jgi:hypothetical protein
MKLQCFGRDKNAVMIYNSCKEALSISGHVSTCTMFSVPTSCLVCGPGFETVTHRIQGRIASSNENK